MAFVNNRFQKNFPGVIFHENPFSSWTERQIWRNCKDIYTIPFLVNAAERPTDISVRLIHILWNMCTCSYLEMMQLIWLRIKAQELMYVDSLEQVSGWQLQHLFLAHSKLLLSQCQINTPRILLSAPGGRIVKFTFQPPLLPYVSTGWLLMVWWWRENSNAPIRIRTSTLLTFGVLL
jgi:hypothetical protein